MTSPFDGLAGIFVGALGDDTPVAYTHGGSTVDVLGIFETPALLVVGLGEPAIVDADAWFACAAADLPTGYGEGDTLVRRGTTYAVKAPLPDGHGMVRLPLLIRQA